MGKRGTGAKKKRQNKGSNRNLLEAGERPKPTAEEAELDKWDEEDNEYLTVLRKRLRNLKKKLDKSSRLKEMDREELNEDQRKALAKHPVNEEVFHELTNIFRGLKTVARNEQLAKNPPQEAKKPDEEEASAAPVVEAPQTPEEALLSLFHVSNLCPTNEEAARPIMAALNTQGVSCTHDELRALVTLATIMSAHYDIDKTRTPEAKYHSSLQDAINYLNAAKDAEPTYVKPAISFGRIRELADALRKTPQWLQVPAQQSRSYGF